MSSVWKRCFAVAILGLFASREAHGDRRNSVNPLGSVFCTGNNVLQYDGRDNETHYFSCKPAHVCGQTEYCVQSLGKCGQPTNKATTGFLSALTELEKYQNQPLKQCCVFATAHYNEDFVGTKCAKLLMNDKREREPHPRLSTKLSLSSNTGGTKGIKYKLVLKSRDDSSVEILHLKNNRTAISLSGKGLGKVRRQNWPKAGLVELFNPRDTEKPVYMDTGFVKTRNGYEITICDVICKRSTTTTTSSTTQTTSNSVTRQRRIPSTVRPMYYDDDPMDVESPLKQQQQQQQQQNQQRQHQQQSRRLVEKQIEIDMDNVAATGMPVSCYSADQLVRMENGIVKRMDELRIGDKVLTAVNGEYENAFFEDVTIWFHRLPNEVATFVTIETESAKSVSLTATHLLPILSCELVDVFTQEELVNTIHLSVFAAEATVGECLIVENDGQMALERIVGVKTENKTGIYSPITRSGSLLVSDVYTSCFTTLRSHQLQWSIYRILDDWFSTFQQIETYLYGNVDFEQQREIPLLMKIALNAAKILLSEKVFQ